MFENTKHTQLELVILIVMVVNLVIMLILLMLILWRLYFGCEGADITWPTDPNHKRNLFLTNKYGLINFSFYSNYCESNLCIWFLFIVSIHALHTITCIIIYFWKSPYYVYLDYLSGMELTANNSWKGKLHENGFKWERLKEMKVYGTNRYIKYVDQYM